VKVTPGDPEIDRDDFWVFAYASLMWRPGFSYVEARPAVLSGYVRDMCFLSIHYRGTPQVPGLVCGLMPESGGQCKGRAYRINPSDIGTVTEYLDGRELITNIYLPRHLDIELENGRGVTARVYIADTAHAQFVGPWSDDRKVDAILRGAGSEGRSLDYLSSLVAHLRDIGIEDARLQGLLRAAESRLAL